MEPTIAQNSVAVLRTKEVHPSLFDYTLRTYKLNGVWNRAWVLFPAYVGYNGLRQS